MATVQPGQDIEQREIEATNVERWPIPDGPVAAARSVRGSGDPETEARAAVRQQREADEQQVALRNDPGHGSSLYLGAPARPRERSSRRTPGAEERPHGLLD